MSEPDREARLAAEIDAIAAGLFPTLSTADRREKARQALGLRSCGQWPRAGMVYIETAPGRPEA